MLSIILRLELQFYTWSYFILSALDLFGNFIKYLYC